MPISNLATKVGLKSEYKAFFKLHLQASRSLAGPKSKFPLYSGKPVA
jgi:hypothetical protein